MFLGHDASWWGVALALVALVLMLPASLLANFLTPLLLPLLLNWAATWNRTSLEKRIAKLENQWAKFEKYTPIDEVQERLLWGISALKMAILSAAGGVIIVMYFGVAATANTGTPAFKGFEGVAGGILFYNLAQTLIIRYSKDFRYWHSPTNRSVLRKEIDALKAIRAKWDQQS